MAFRVVYQAERCQEPYRTAWDSAGGEKSLTPAQRELVGDVVATLEVRGDEVDSRIRAAAQHWVLERIAATDRAVLRVAVAELLSRQGAPARVVIDEAIEMARKYGQEESGKFVNGVLDRIARELRPGEL